MSIDLSIDDDGVATVTINRPERMNAMDLEHYQLLSKAWMQVRDDPKIRCAVVTGAGNRAFTAGADIKSHIANPAEFADLWLTQKDQLLNRGLEVWKPIIAAVNGVCIGGGVTLMLACDIRVAASTATFGVAEVKRGLIAGNGGTQRLLKQVPYAVGMEMLLTGDAIDAATAERWGLVNKVVPQEQVMAVAMDYARKVAANAPLAVQASKELAIRSLDLELADGLRLELMTTRILKETEDLKEGAAAFAEKRKPNFKGR